ncbi:hypothetical protein NSERUTF1_2300 [Nocardia seriolae]|nr:hypothetical protein NSERUTF1_2300 [Nocardia seriolae]
MPGRRIVVPAAHGCRVDRPIHPGSWGWFTAAETTKVEW